MAGALRLWVMAAAAAAAMTPASGAGGAEPARRPQRIMSLALCTDLLALQLASKERIASVTYLAHGAAETLFPGRDAGIAVNQGTAEDILKVQPDLILADAFSASAARRLARRVGAHVVEVENASDFEGVRRSVRHVGAAIGEPARAEVLIDRMDAELAWLAAHPPARRPRVLAWSGEAAVGSGPSLPNAIVAATGAINLGARPGRRSGGFDVEEILAADPDALLYGAVRPGTPPLASDQGQHRVIRTYYAGRRIGYNEVPYTCGLPQSADAAVDLRRRLDALPPRAWRLR